MDLSPNDVRNYEFPTQLRGYDKDEVDEFKERAAEALENQKQENLKLSMEIDSIKGQLQGLRQFEDAIKSAAIDARRNADLTIENAKKEAELLLNNARGEAERIVASHSKKMSECEAQLTDLKLARNSYLGKLRKLIDNHLNLLEHIEKEDRVGKLIEDELEVTDSSEVEANIRETIATEPSSEGPIVAEEAEVSETIVDEEQIEEQPEESDEKPSEPQASIPDMSEMDEDAARQLKEVLQDQQPEAEKDPSEIDPELAAALDSYQQGVTAEDAPAQGEFVETTARAEDIPPGFISPDGETTASTADTARVAPEAQAEPTEHNSISIDAAAETETAPQDISHELDAVVAKFEEEMDKADKA